MEFYRLNCFCGAFSSHVVGFWGCTCLHSRSWPPSGAAKARAKMLGSGHSLGFACQKSSDRLGLAGKGPAMDAASAVPRFAVEAK